MVEEDDLVENLVSYLIALYVLLMASILILNNWLLKKIWKPFYGLIYQLRHFSIEKDQKILAPATPIEEFQLLIETIEKLIQKSRDRYVEQKQFIENASHELQTPLAISINKLELFLENNELGGNQLGKLAAVLDNLGRLTRLNKSLLLLSKIENHQFVDKEEVDFNILTQQIIADFNDFAAHKNSGINHLTETYALKHKTNKDLAVILVTNLIKNALVHGLKKEDIQIVIKEKSFSVKNQGLTEALDGKTLFSRSTTPNTHKKSTGLGLAIAKAITDKYGLQLSYSFDDGHVFTVIFPSLKENG